MPIKVQKESNLIRVRLTVDDLRNVLSFDEVCGGEQTVTWHSERFDGLDGGVHVLVVSVFTEWLFDLRDAARLQDVQCPTQQHAIPQDLIERSRRNAVIDERLNP